jgi:hypothetical protein
MYSVYKSNKLIVGLTLLMGTIASTGYAKECATLQFAPSKVDGTNYVTRLKHNNGLLLESETSKSTEPLPARRAGHNNGLSRSNLEMINGDKKYFLAEGDHSLTIELWNKNDLRRIFQQNLYNNGGEIDEVAIPAKVSTFKLNIEKNMAYQANITVDGEFDIISINTLCALESNNLLTANNEEVKEVQNGQTLPVQLEKRLRLVMNRVIDSGKSSGVIRSTESAFFGAVKDISYKGKQGHIRLLSVLPHSLAYNLGLLRGDVIVGYGDMKTTTLEETLLALEYKKEMEFDVLRNGSLVKLRMAYKPVAIPQVVYGINETDLKMKIIGSSEFKTNLQFDVDQLMLEVANFYRGNNYEGRLTLARDNTYNSEFGLVGSLKKISNSGYAIKVGNVLPFTSAKAIGLESGDSIISVNSKIMETADISHINKELSGLVEGKEYSISVKRGNEYITLREKYVPSRFSKFALVIDLDSAEKHDINIATIENIKLQFAKARLVERTKNTMRRKSPGNADDYWKKDNGNDRRSGVVDQSNN